MKQVNLNDEASIPHGHPMPRQQVAIESFSLATIAKHSNEKMIGRFPLLTEVSIFNKGRNGLSAWNQTFKMAMNLGKAWTISTVEKLATIVNIGGCKLQFDAQWCKEGETWENEQTGDSGVHERNSWRCTNFKLILSEEAQFENLKGQREVINLIEKDAMQAQVEVGRKASDRFNISNGVSNDSKEATEKEVADIVAPKPTK